MAISRLSYTIDTCECNHRHPSCGLLENDFRFNNLNHYCCEGQRNSRWFTRTCIGISWVSGTCFYILHLRIMDYGKRYKTKKWKYIRSDTVNAFGCKIPKTAARDGIKIKVQLPVVDGILISFRKTDYTLIQSFLSASRTAKHAGA